ncbi:MAG: type II secretion system F family protein [Peptococcaceae bacterium]
MAQSYQYRVRDFNGKLQTGFLEAEGMTAAKDVLRRRRFVIIDLALAPEKKRSISLSGFLEQKVTVKDLALFCRQFATVIEAGIPALTCLDILSRQAENNRLQKAITQMITELRTGRTLTEAMRQHPKVFPGILTSMVEAGETGGVLDQALTRMADHFERDHDIREKVKSAMYYPAALLIVMFLAVGFMVTYVLPNFITILTSLNVELPLSTRILMKVSEILGHNWYLALAGLAALIFALTKIAGLKGMQEKLDGVKLRLPIFGPLIKKIVISRFCRTLSTLLHAGVPLLQALEIVRETAGNAVIARAAAGALENVRKGLEMAGPLAASGVFPPMVTRMIAVGEETGTIDQLLEKVAQFYDREVNSGVGRLSSMLEPVLLIIIGVVIGSIIISIMLPMLNVMSAPIE